jgi:hypothetical protein
MREDEKKKEGIDLKEEGGKKITGKEQERGKKQDANLLSIFLFC